MDSAYQGIRFHENVSFLLFSLTDLEADINLLRKGLKDIEKVSCTILLPNQHLCIQDLQYKFYI